MDTIVAAGLIRTITGPHHPATVGFAWAVGKAGTGLGLAIAERIASAHRGRFDLFPRQGGGTEARIELPLPSQ
jgi:signal transduction histidine kinase